MPTTPRFSAGPNIAMKVPPHAYEETVRFYREVLGLPQLPEHLPSVVFEFGHNQLWIDRVPGLSQAETWLEVRTNDLAAAGECLANEGAIRCDEIEPLPEDFRAFWVSSPASIIHLVREERPAQEQKEQTP